MFAVDAASTPYFRIACRSGSRSSKKSLLNRNSNDLRRLVVGRQVVVLGHVLRAEAAVRGRVVELERVDDAALHRRHDLAAGKLGDRHAHLLEKVGGKAHGAVLEALQVGDGVHLVLEPAEGLGRHREADEAVDVEAQDVLGQLAVELLAAALVEPAEHRGGVAAEDRAGAEERGGLVLAVPVDRHRVRRVEHAVVHGVHHLEGADDRAGRQQVDVEAAARHLLDTRGVLAGEVHPDVGGRPRRLHLHDERRLREHRRCGKHASRSGATGERSLPKERAAIEIGCLGHSFPPRVSVRDDAVVFCRDVESIAVLQS